MLLPTLGMRSQLPLLLVNWAPAPGAEWLHTRTGKPRVESQFCHVMFATVT